MSTYIYNNFQNFENTHSKLNSINSIDQELWKLRIELKLENRKLKTIEKEIEYFNGSSVISNLYASYYHKLADRPGKKVLIKVFEDRIQNCTRLLDAKNRDISSKRKWTQTFFGKSKALKSLIDQAEKIDKIRLELIQTCDDKKESFQKNEEEILSIGKSIENFTGFDISVKLENFNLLKIEVKRIENEIEILENLNESVKIATKKEVETLELVQKDIIIATNFERELSYAKNGYEKKLIHQKCEQYFGNGNARNIAINLKKQEQGLERAINQTISKVKEKKLTEARINLIKNNCKTIAIDGNNLCNKTINGEQSFIGLKALIAIVKCLENKYKVLIVFDEGILGVTKMNSRRLIQNFSDNVEIKIEQDKIGADYLLFDYASDDEKCFIISNDLYREYLDKEVLKNNRKISCYIYENKILMPLLDLKISY